MPGSPAQEKIKKEIEKLRNQLSEGVDLPIEIGDTIKMGRFKNKKVVIKSIEWEDDGDLVINGRPALKFRITKDDVNEKIDYKKALKKLRIPQSLSNNKQKLVNYLSTNPQILAQLLRLIGEGVNKKNIDGKDSGEYRTYTAPEDSDIDEPYKRDTTATDGKEEK